MGIDGNLYFANAVKNDSRQDYCCIANFQTIRIIRQKPPMAVEVQSCTYGQAHTCAAVLMSVSHVV